MTIDGQDPFLAQIEEFAIEWLNRPSEQFPTKADLRERAMNAIDEALIESRTLTASDERRLLEALVAAWDSAYMFLDESDRFWKYAQECEFKLNRAQEDVRFSRLADFKDDDLVYELQRRLQTRDEHYTEEQA